MINCHNTSFSNLLTVYTILSFISQVINLFYAKKQHACIKISSLKKEERSTLFYCNILKLWINYLFWYWTKFEIRCRKVLKAGEFCQNAKRVSSRFKRESCRYKRMYIRASKRGFGNDSSRFYTYSRHIVVAWNF